MARGGSVGGDVHTLRELFGSSFYLIDYYQREYEWSPGDVRTLVNDLVDAFRLDRPHGRHHRRREQGEQYFLGPFVFVQHNRNERFLVDGQQRSRRSTFSSCTCTARPRPETTVPPPIASVG